MPKDFWNHALHDHNKRQRKKIDRNKKIHAHKFNGQFKRDYAVLSSGFGMKAAVKIQLNDIRKTSESRQN